jgi:hypothetical protein
MKVATVSLESLSPYSQSRRIMTPRNEKETYEAYEHRTWRERVHIDDDGNAFIPPMAFKRALDGAAKFLRLRIEGKGKSEYGKHFKAGVLVTEGLRLGVAGDAVEYEDLPLSAQGKPGEANVIKRMPVFRKWKGDVQFYVLDETITEPVFERHLVEAGNFIGIGRFRPMNGGYYGRFKVNGIVWS